MSYENFGVFHTAKYRINGLTITLLVVGDKVFLVPILFEGDDFKKLVNLELPVLGKVETVEEVIGGRIKWQFVFVKMKSIV